MLTPLERVDNLLADLRYAHVDFDALYAGNNSLTPLESVELFLQEQQRLRVLKQNLLRRKRANLPAEKTLDSFDFGFQYRCRCRKNSASYIHFIKINDIYVMLLDN